MICDPAVPQLDNGTRLQRICIDLYLIRTGQETCLDETIHRRIEVSLGRAKGTLRCKSAERKWRRWRAETWRATMEDAFCYDAR